MPVSVAKFFVRSGNWPVGMEPRGAEHNVSIECKGFNYVAGWT